MEHRLLDNIKGWGQEEEMEMEKTVKINGLKIAFPNTLRSETTGSSLTLVLMM